MSKLTFAAVAAATMLLFAASAFAGTNSLKGTIKGEGGAKITLKVKLNKKGEPIKVSQVSVKHVGYTCNDESSGTLDANIPGSAKVAKSTSDGKTRWSFITPYDGDGTEFSGEVNRKGTRATGEVIYYYGQGPENEISCGFSKGFTATK